MENYSVYPKLRPITYTCSILHDVFPWTIVSSDWPITYAKLQTNTVVNENSKLYQARSFESILSSFCRTRFTSSPIRRNSRKFDDDTNAIPSIERAENVIKCRRHHNHAKIASLLFIFFQPTQTRAKKFVL